MLTDRVLLALCGCAFLLCGFSQEHRLAPAGHSGAATVLSVNGDWFLLVGNEKRQIIQWQPLFPKTIVRLQTPAVSSSIVLVDQNMREIANRSCSASKNECVRPIIVPEFNATGSAHERSAGFFHSVVEALFHGEWRSSLAEVRTSSLDLKDGVVELAANGRANLEPILSTLPGGRVVVEFRPVEGPATPATVPKVTIVSDAAGSWTTVLPKMSAGLYELRVVSLNSINTGDATAWVLLANPAQATAARTAFRDATATATRWPRHVPPETIQTFLRGCLRQLASP